MGLQKFILEERTIYNEKFTAFQCIVVLEISSSGNESLCLKVHCVKTCHT